MDRLVGTVTYTTLLTHSAGIRCDVTIIRTDPDRFLLITGGSTGSYDFSWIKAQSNMRSDLEVNDISDELCCIGLWGPRSREILAAITTDDVTNEAFPYLAARELTVNHVKLLAVRISYVGELGW